MKNINNYWVDNNNNRWNINLYTESQAEKYSKTLIDCSDCSGCSYCSNCSYCSDCSRCSNCSNCSDCSGCLYCSDCSGCSYCSNCSDFKSNPQKYNTPLIGSRNSSTYFYWGKEQNQIICGCWKGTLVKFEERVKSAYTKNHKHYKEYFKEIKIMKYLSCQIKNTLSFR